MKRPADAIAPGGGRCAARARPRLKGVRPLPEHSARMLRTLIGSLDGMVFRCQHDVRSSFEYVSGACERLTGYTAEALLGGRRLGLRSLVHPEDRARLSERPAAQPASQKAERYQIEYRLHHRDGSYRWVRERGVARYDRHAGGWQYEGFIEDISERQRAGEALRRAEDRFQGIFEHALEGIFHSTPDGRYLMANPALARLYGYDSPEQLMEQMHDIPGQLYVEPARRVEFQRQIERHGAVSGFEFQAYRRSGEIIWVSVNAHARRDGPVGALVYEGTVADVTERRTYQAQIEHQANYDALTGLANRTLLNTRLHEAISRAAGEQGTLAVAFLDLDQFKFINDTFGHELGDSLLQSMAERLRASVRETDLVARQGGDEFVLLLSGYQGDELVGLIQRVHAAIAQPWRAGRREFHVSSSIGAAVYPQDGRSADVLLRNADAAMYKAKENGRNGYQFFTAELNHKLVERLDIEHRLRGALARSQFLLHYQPRIDMSTGRIGGAEALLRWRVPQRGLVAPDRFIGVAEDTGLIVPIGRWVLHTACQQARAWQEAGLPPIVVSVNVSPRQFREGSIVDTIAEALDAQRLAACYLQIELTEGLAMHGAEKYVHMLGQIKELGVQIAVDDFGTGYSSLSYLKRFPIDQLKVDRSFVTDLATDPDDAVIVQAIIALGHKLGLRVVAEGVETEEQLDYLRRSGCDEMQGYLFGAPMIASEFAALLAREDERQPRALRA